MVCKAEGSYAASLSELNISLQVNNILRMFLVRIKVLFTRHEKSTVSLIRTIIHEFDIKMLQIWLANSYLDVDVQLRYFNLSKLKFLSNKETGSLSAKQVVVLSLHI